MGLTINNTNQSMLSSIANNNEQPEQVDPENAGEDVIMMNIPREGNADQLNKSTKLTLSSKKQYDNHMQNISLHQHVHGSQYLPQSTNNNNRSKMNSTMMVKFSQDKNSNQRAYLNKSTLLPNNVGVLPQNPGLNSSNMNVGNRNI